MTTQFHLKIIHRCVSIANHTVCTFTVLNSLQKQLAKPYKPNKPRGPWNRSYLTDNFPKKPRYQVVAIRKRGYSLTHEEGMSSIEDREKVLKEKKYQKKQKGER